MPGDEPKKRWNPTRIQFLVRHSSGTYYARGFRDGKQLWHSLKTDKISVAKVRLADWIKEHRQRAQCTRAAVDGKMLFGEAARLHLDAVADNVGIKESTRHYNRQIVRALLKSWPGLAETDLRRVSAAECRAWSATFARMTSATRFNATVGVLRHIFKQAIQAGVLFTNPAQDLKRKKVKAKELVLPTREQFREFVRSISTAGAWCSQACADLVEFLAFTGCRVGETAHVCWQDVDFQSGQLLVRGHPVGGTKNGEVRRVPLIPGARALLVRLRDEASPDPLQPVLKVRECQKAMDRAAGIVKMRRITHHDLRHLFATVCIEAGTDIPTVARWLGHKDGGVLAMKTYGHLRDEHSQASAAKIHFGTGTRATNSPHQQVPL